MASDHWNRALDRKRQALSKLKVTPRADITNLEGFQTLLDSLCQEYAAKNFTSFIRNRLAPHFDHLRSFTQAINSCTQSTVHGTLIWGCLQIVLEVACRFAEGLDEIFDLLDTLHRSLPLFKQYIDLFPKETTLKDALVYIYEDYIDFCVYVTDYVSRRGWRNLLRNIYTSSHRRSLENLTSKVDRHCRNFEDEATIASRRQIRSDHSAILARMTSGYAIISSESFPIFDVPYRKNPKFFGRDDILAKLTSNLEEVEGQTSIEPTSCALTGLGGVGKTQVTLEYSYRNSRKYDSIFWLAAEDSGVLTRAFCNIGLRVGLWKEDHGSSSKHIRAVQEWLKATDKKWLIIFDNVEQWDSVAQFWPGTCVGSSSVIVTSQRPPELLPWVTKHIKLNHFDRENGAKFLLWQLGKTNATQQQQHEAKMISSLVDGLPVFLTHISGHISQSQCTLEEYKRLFEDSSSDWQSSNPDANWMYEKHTSAVFQVALSKLSKHAQHLVFVMAYLSPDGVAEDQLFPSFEGDHLAYLQVLNRKSVFDIIAEVHSRQLVHREKSETAFLTMHRSLQEGIQQHLCQNQDERIHAFQCAYEIVRRKVPAPTILLQAEPEKWARFEPHLQQLLSLHRGFVRSSPRIKGFYELAQLFFDVGMNFWDKGLAQEGRDILFTAEKVLDEIGYKSMSTIRANIHSVLGSMLEDYGIFHRTEGLARRRQVLGIRRTLLLEKGQDVTFEDEILELAAYTDIAFSLIEINACEEIEETCTTALQKYETWGDEEKIPYEYAKYHFLMSCVYMTRKNTDAAVNAAQKAGELQTKADPAAMLANVFRFNHARTLFQSGLYESALDAIQEIHASRIEGGGPTNSMTIQSGIALAIVLWQLDRLSEAEDILREYLTPSMSSHVNEQNKIRSRFYLSQVLYKAGHLYAIPEADELLKSAKSDMQRLIKLDPPPHDQQPSHEGAWYDWLASYKSRMFVFQKLSTTANDAQQVADQVPVSNAT